MPDFEVKNTDTGQTYKATVNENGSIDVRETSSGGGGGLPLGLLWIAAIIGMPIIFFTEKIYQYEQAPVLYIVSYLVCLIAFLFTFFPGLKEKKLPTWLKKGISMAFPIFMYTIFVFSGIMYYTLGDGNCDFIFIYIAPIMTYGLILYHVRDAHLIYPMMYALKIKRYSFIGTYFLQWLAICVVFYFGIMMPFGNILGEFQLFIVCYMYIILVDVKRYLLRKGRYLD